MSETHEINDFDCIAGFYDELVSWAPYELWVNELLRDLKGFGLKDGDRILDVACGSGLSTIPLARKGFRVTGVDRSGAMLDLAKEKALKENLHIDLIRAEVPGLRAGGPFNGAICMHSGFDYILDLHTLQRAFSDVRSRLRTGGLFAFDKCLDEPGFYHKPHSERRDLDDAVAYIDYRWRRRQRLLEQRCRICFMEDGVEQSVIMLQRMRAVEVSQLIGMVEKAGFSTLRKPRQFTMYDPGMGIFRAV